MIRNIATDAPEADTLAERVTLRVATHIAGLSASARRSSSCSFVGPDRLNPDVVTYDGILGPVE